MKSNKLFNTIFLAIILRLFFAFNAYSQNVFFNDSLNSKKHFNIELFGNLTAK